MKPVPVMDDLTKRVETLSPAKRALLERRLRTEIRRKAPQPPLTAKERREPARASFAQERLWFLQQLEPQSAAYNVPRAIRIRGNLNMKCREQSVNKIMAGDANSARHIVSSALRFELLKKPQP